MINIINLEMSKWNSGSSVPEPRSQSRDLRPGPSTTTPPPHPPKAHLGNDTRLAAAHSHYSELPAPGWLWAALGILYPRAARTTEASCTSRVPGMSLPRGSANRPMGPARPATCFYDVIRELSCACRICSLALDRRACWLLAPD